MKNLMPIVAIIFLMALIAQSNNVFAESPFEGIYQKLDQIQNTLGNCCGKIGVPKTGQTISFAPGDDGDLEKGIPWPIPRLTDNGNETVSDNLTGLMWTKKANLYGAANWSEALTSCDLCSEGGHTDWRLPNVRELHSLLNYGGPQYSMLPADHPFTGLPASPTWYYWSSSTHGSAETAWVMSFENGWMLTVGAVSSYGVWCVRGGN